MRTSLLGSVGGDEVPLLNKCGVGEGVDLKLISAENFKVVIGG